MQRRVVVFLFFAVLPLSLNLEAQTRYQFDFPPKGTVEILDCQRFDAKGNLKETIKGRSVWNEKQNTSEVQQKYVNGKWQQVRDNTVTGSYETYIGDDLLFEETLSAYQIPLSASDKRVYKSGGRKNLTIEHLISYSNDPIKEGMIPNKPVILKFSSVSTRPVRVQVDSGKKLPDGTPAPPEEKTEMKKSTTVIEVETQLNRVFHKDLEIDLSQGPFQNLARKKSFEIWEVSEKYLTVEEADRSHRVVWYAPDLKANVKVDHISADQSRLSCRLSALTSSQSDSSSPKPATDTPAESPRVQNPSTFPTSPNRK